MSEGEYQLLAALLGLLAAILGLGLYAARCESQCVAADDR